MGTYGLFLMATPDSAAAGNTGTEGIIIWLVVMVAVFYFILWRPQKKREKAEKQLRSSIQPGDQIVTIGGFVGRVLSVKDDEVVFETGADRTKLTIKKHAIAQRNSPEQPAPAPATADTAEEPTEKKKLFGGKKKDEEDFGADN